MWLQIATGQRTEIPTIKFSNVSTNNVTVDYSDGGDHYDMAVASLLYAVRLYRDPVSYTHLDVYKRQHKQLAAFIKGVHIELHKIQQGSNQMAESQ